MGLTENIIDHSGVFSADGSYLERDSRVAGHVHSRLATAAGIFRLGAFTAREDWCSWARTVFDWSLRHVASSFGWVSERAGESRGGCETCCIVDAIELAVALAEHGHPEYWEAAERFVRNHLLESQCRQSGGFSGHTLPNDYCWIHPATGRPEHNVAGCCSPAGVRGLWLAWDRIATNRNGVVSIQFPLNRSARRVEVTSWLPYLGKVTIDVREECSLAVRLPAWASPGQTRLTVNGQARGAAAVGGFLEVPDLAAGDEVSVVYPLRRERIREVFMDFDVDATWRGNTVVAVEPTGQHEPLYRRSGMDTDCVPTRRREAIRPIDGRVSW